MGNSHMWSNIGGALMAIAILAAAFGIKTFIWSFIHSDVQMGSVSKKSVVIAIICAILGNVIMKTLSLPTAQEVKARMQFEDMFIHKKKFTKKLNVSLIR